ncbi:MAG: Yip1 family protein [Sphingosinicella sp.]
MTDGSPTPPTGYDPSSPPSRGGGQKPLVERAKDIIMKPRSEWAVIDGEASTIGSIYTGYVMILAAIGPIAMVIGHQLFGVGFGIKPSLSFSITSAVVGYVLSLVGVYIASLVIDMLAPTFGGTRNSLNAFKVAAYSWTAAWLAAIFAILPALAILSLLGLYSLYLLYTGLPRLMRVSEDRAVGYIVLCFVVMIVVYLVIGLITGAMVTAIVGPMMPTVMIRY